MPIPEAAAVPARPTKWPDLRRGGWSMERDYPMLEAKRLAPTRLQCMEREARK